MSQYERLSYTNNNENATAVINTVNCLCHCLYNRQRRMKNIWQCSSG